MRTRSFSSPKELPDTTIKINFNVVSRALKKGGEKRKKKEMERVRK